MVIRIESWKVFSPTTMAYLLQKLGGYLEWLELVWIEPIYMMGPILRAERAWPTMHENLRDLAKQRLPGNIQRCEKRLVNLVKQDPGRVRQNS